MSNKMITKNFMKKKCKICNISINFFDVVREEYHYHTDYKDLHKNGVSEKNTIYVRNYYCSKCRS